MSDKHIHFEHISDYFSAIGRVAPSHPLVSTLKVSASELAARPRRFPEGARLSGGFYYLSLKQIVSGQVHYGRTEYDCQTGTLLAMAPRQTMATSDVITRSDTRVLMLHPDYIRGHAVETLISDCGFFHYQVNEALHLSESEQQTLHHLFDALDEELMSSRYDPSSRDIVLAHLTVLLHYCQRFYRRQFLQRREMVGDWHTRLQGVLDTHYSGNGLTTLPDLQVLSTQLRVSPRYLSDALKSETGSSAKACIQQYIIDKAKSLLLADDQNVSSVAYSLGYESGNYFTRVFKKKTGMTPSQYRDTLRSRH
ncbi:helix-turn-helix domain-containing protein [Granulosicoccus sp. 3-233]|uniref:helix-turn-helix domain-containing protein n=1 Tax=Granulosicoccus sp. 3-233 TaxID=3417969 RepID=UPI003D327B11